MFYKDVASIHSFSMLDKLINRIIRNYGKKLSQRKNPAHNLKVNRLVVPTNDLKP